MTVSEYLVDFLAEKGVSDVFGLPGGVILDFLYAVNQRSGIQAHLSYHEQSAGFAACGYAQYKHSPGVAYATRGPGFTNLITAIADAYSDSLPVFFITAHSGKAVKSMMRFEKDQELDTVSMSSNITKYASVIEDPASVPDEIERAYTAAMTGRKGPVLLDFSSQIWNKEVNEEFTANADPCNIYIPEMAVKTIIEILESAERPLLLVGDGIRQSEITNILAVLTAKWNIPVLSSRGSQDVGAICKNYYGYIGSHGIRYSNYIFTKADVVISMGNRMAFPTDSQSFHQGLQNKKIVWIDMDNNELGREIPNTIKIECDIKGLLPQLLTAKYRTTHANTWLDTCKHIKSKLFSSDTNQAVESLQNIFSLLGRQHIIVCDVGNNEFWGSRAYELSGINNRILYSKSFGALGCAIGKSIGVQYASKASVICLVGDQGFQLNIQELQAIAQERLPIAIILLNNHSSGMIRDRENQMYDGEYIHTTKTSGYGTPDFETLARGYGIEFHSYHSMEEKDIRQVLDNLDAPTLIEIELEEEIILTPNLPKGRTMQRMSPELDEDILLELDCL